MAVKGFKTGFAYSDLPMSEATVWTAVARIRDITCPTAEAEDIETSAMDSPSDDQGPWKEWSAGWADAGEVELTIEFDKAKNGEIYALFRVDKAFRISFADGSTWSFAGYMKGFGNEVDRKDIVTAKVTIKVSGKPEYKAAAAA
ncbi:MAG: phage tail tube protein [Bacillota bacterium]